MNRKKSGGLHIVKRPEISWQRAMAIRAAALVLAIVACGLVTWLTTGENPGGVFATIWEGSFSTRRRFWDMLQNLAFLLMVSLAMAPAFRMKFWNIGGEGQILIGCLLTAAVMKNLGTSGLPSGVLILLEVLLGTAAGAVWGLVPAIFKARWNTNETLFTLMMNYVATQLVAYYIIIWESPKGSGKVGVLNQKTQAGWLPNIGTNKYLLTVIVAGILTVFIYIYMNYSKHGYELAVVGESGSTARYVGINVRRVIMRTMALSGAICGLTGVMIVAGSGHTLTTSLTDSRGFTAVMVAWMAKFNPVGMIFISFLLVFMSKGAGEVATNFGLNQSFSDILTSIIIFFLIGCEFFIQYQIVRSQEHEAPSSAGTAGGGAGKAAQGGSGMAAESGLKGSEALPDRKEAE